MVKRLGQIPFFPPKWEGMTALALHRKAQEAAPFARDPMGAIFAFSYEQMKVFTDERWTRQLELEGMIASGVRSGPMFEFVSDALLFANGQVHRDRRGPLARSFAKPVLAALRPDVQSRVAKMVAGMKGRGEVDFLAEIASPMPAQVIASLLGISENDTDKFADHVYSAIRGLSLVSSEVRAESDADLAQINQYIDAEIAARRAQSRDDFISAYLDKTDGGAMNEREVRAQIVGLVMAGSDTTRGALASTVSQLMQNRDQWELLCSDPDKYAAGAVAEGLRYDPVIGALPRVVAEPREVQGYKFSTATFVAISMITVLRDPSVYADPDRFDITRDDHPQLHPVFGTGPHRCLGEVLAKIELEEALKTLAREVPHMTLVGEPPKLRGYGAVRSVGPMQVHV